MTTTTVELDDSLAAALGPETLELWRLDRGPALMKLYVAHSPDGAPTAALLTTGRPASMSTKIAHTWRAVDIVGSDVALEGLVDEAVAEALASRHVSVKWQIHDGSGAAAQWIEGLGFERMRAPYVSAAGTEGVTGFVRWLRPVPHDEPPYYSQTSTFTCGAVAALVASEIRGSGGFAEGVDNRDRELDFWRRASNYPSCEPVGLAVALRESLADAAGTSPVEVFLDTDGPALLESYPEGFDRAFREELQANSLRKALGSDVAVRRERVSVDEIAARLRAGGLALLLIDLEPMFGFAVPHWVLAHAAADGVVIIDDPWISASWGETWVDAHELPVSTDDLDRMLAWGDDGYRGVVFVTRG